MNHLFSTFFFSSIGGLVPALIWLWFFLREDRRHPEPKRMVALAFLAGTIAVFFVLPVEKYTATFLLGLPLLITWAAVEEVFKFLAAYVAILWNKEVDEPVDTMIYMITIALGFAAVETGLFLLDPFSNGNITDGILTGDLRFMGASLLHTLSSSMVGIALALSFYKKPIIRFLYLCTGLVCAITLHTLFNFFIMKSLGQETAGVFFFVWLGIITLLFMFEKAKRINRPRALPVIT